MVDYGALEGNREDGDFEVELNISEAATERANRAMNFRANVVAAVAVIVSTLAILLIGTAGGYKVSDVKSLVSFFGVKLATSTKPNFVFILADDLGYGSLSKEVTPFLQGMRKNGVILQNYYSQESCTPARAALMTGRYPLSVGWQYGDVKDTFDGGLSLNETTIAEVLQENGYVNYIYGKWNLGHESPRYLPTARGFHYFLGFLSSYSTYWTKSDPDHEEFIDFMYSDEECFYQYNGEDATDYSTALYRDMAIKKIEVHDFAKPMFLYIPFQAVHDPFADESAGMSEGLTKEYIDADTYDFITSSYEGSVERQYFFSLALLDGAVESIYDALDSSGQLDNTYFIFASDNGGCPEGGGRNIGLRGGKGSLYEGGTKVNAIIGGGPVPDSVHNTNFMGLFHVSDWFPTILTMAGITDFKSKNGFALDGIDQYDALFNGAENPRSLLLYNYYTNVEHAKKLDLWSTGGAAIRNVQYKLMHGYGASAMSQWYSSDTILNGDDDLNKPGACTQDSAWEGDLEPMMFDLLADPSETENIYYSMRSEVVEAKEELYAALDALAARSQMCLRPSDSASARPTWEESNRYLVPWTAAATVDFSGYKGKSLTYPLNCGLYSPKGETAAITK